MKYPEDFEGTKPGWFLLLLLLGTCLSIWSCNVESPPPQYLLKIRLEPALSADFKAGDGKFDSVRVDFSTPADSNPKLFYQGPYEKRGDTLVLEVNQGLPDVFTLFISAYSGTTLKYKLRITYPKDGHGTIVLVGPLVIDPNTTTKPDTTKTKPDTTVTKPDTTVTKP
ncbi:MAG: hypothetical protein ABIQ93_13105, partial [Saprospiraceae bacterium]